MLLFCFTRLTAAAGNPIDAAPKKDSKNLCNVCKKGKNKGLKIPRGKPCAGSSPAFGTNLLYKEQAVTETPHLAKKCHKVSLGIKIVCIMQTDAVKMHTG